MKIPKDPIVTFPLGLVLGLLVGVASTKMFLGILWVALVMGAIVIVMLLLLANLLGVYPPAKPQRKRKNSVKPRTKKGDS